jgi:PAS domain S-box-containing protein
VGAAHDDGSRANAVGAGPDASTEQFQRLIVEAMSEGVVVEDPSGRIVFANPAAKQILGRTFEELVRGSSAEAHWGLVHPDGTPWPMAEQPAVEALRTRRPVRRALMGVDPGGVGRRWLLVTATPILRASADPGGVIVTFVDVTDQHETELARRESEQRFRGAVESMLDAFMIASAVREGDRIVDFVFDFVNGAAEANIGLRPEELVGQRMLDVAPNLRARGAFGLCVDVVETGVPVVMDVPWFDGPRVHGSFEVRGVKVDDGIALTIRNVTQQRLVEASTAPNTRPTGPSEPAPVATADATTNLTARELEALALLGAGYSTREIAERLFISQNTARNHVQRTIAKLGAHSRLEAVAIARRSGLLLGDAQPVVSSGAR